MENLFRFEKLIIWKDSILYAKNVYKLSDKFPRTELFGLISQIKRAVLSISSNIAEGSASTTVNDFCHYLDIAIKSTTETVSQLLFALEMGYITEKELKPLYENAQVLIKKIQSFKKYLRSKKGASHA